MNTEELDNRAKRNRTLLLSDSEAEYFRTRLITLAEPVGPQHIENKTICQDINNVVKFLPDGFVDLLFVDPPYNLTKRFGSELFTELSHEEYRSWFESWFAKLFRALKPTASVYICSDWRSSSAIQIVAERFLHIRNRITWEREKGRGSKSNWKNCSEDIWFCTVSDEYYFNPDAVKLRRRVIAPYTDDDGRPKDWEETSEGGVRLTHPSNIWTDLTVPFWSMSENTDHPTQKPEKLLAKVILASSKKHDFVFDPFLGSGTTSVVAKKLGRRYCGVELDHRYCCFAEKRIYLAEQDHSIQGYVDGVFWERNSSPLKTNKGSKRTKHEQTASLL